MQILARGHAGYRGLVHLDLLGDIAQHQRTHGFGAEIEESSLCLDDGLGHLEHGFGTRLEALDQPAGFLQLAAQIVGVVAACLGNQARVVLVDREAGLAIRRQRDLPAAIDLVRVSIGGDVLRRGIRVAGTGFGIQRAHEFDDGIELLVAGTQTLAQARTIVAGEHVQAVGNQLARLGQPWRFLIEVFELDIKAFTERARGDTHRVEALNSMTHAFHLVFGDLEQVGQALRDHRIGFLQVPIVIDTLDDRGGDAAIMCR